jgi:hypothetical protein
MNATDRAHTQHLKLLQALPLAQRRAIANLHRMLARAIGGDATPRKKKGGSK